MTWVAFRKHLYLPLLAVACSGALATLILADAQATRFAAVFAAAVILFVPGAIGRWLLRDLLASRALVTKGQFTEGLEASRQFLRKLERRPWIRHAIWTQFGIYTLDVKAMALNNAGAALIELRRFDEARETLQRARAADPDYPIPVFNMAVVAKASGDDNESDRLAGEAARLGFAGGRLDVTLNAIGTAYARMAA